MSAVGTPVDIGTPESRRPSVLKDVWVITKRGLWHMRRHPEALADATFQPVMFVLLFAYVFGGAIAVPGGGDYKEFLMGGIFAQSIVFGGSFGVAMTIASDRTNGAMDRLRSLPIGRGAVLGGHAVANLLKAFLPMLLMSICGYIDRLADPRRRGRRGRRLRAAARVRLRDDLDRRAARLAALDAGGGAGRRVRRDLPDHLHREHVRAGRDAAGRAAHVRGVEPGDDAGGVAADPLRQPAPGGRRAATRGRCSTRSSTRCWSAPAIVAVCAPIAVSRFQRSITD